LSAQTFEIPGSHRGDIPASQAWNGTIYNINVRRLAVFDPDQNAVAGRLVVILRNMGNAILTRCAMQQVVNATEHRTTISLLKPFKVAAVIAKHAREKLAGVDVISIGPVFGEMVAGGVQYSVVVIVPERDGK